MKCVSELINKWIRFRNNEMFMIYNWLINSEPSVLRVTLMKQPLLAISSDAIHSHRLCCIEKQFRIELFVICSRAKCVACVKTENAVKSFL